MFATLASHSVVYKQHSGKESNVVSPLHLLLQKGTHKRGAFGFLGCLRKSTQAKVG